MASCTYPPKFAGTPRFIWQSQISLSEHWRHETSPANLEEPIAPDLHWAIRHLVDNLHLAHCILLITC